jgi:hypothetical protein
VDETWAWIKQAYGYDTNGKLTTKTKKDLIAEKNMETIKKMQEVFT